VIAAALQYIFQGLCRHLVFVCVWGGWYVVKIHLLFAAVKKYIGKQKNESLELAYFSTVIFWYLACPTFKYYKSV
jgi:hypothetical protein